jgi:hypothetical protein
MGMPCEVNSVLKFSTLQGFPTELTPNSSYQVHKKGYRIIPIDVPIPLVDNDWVVRAEVIVRKLIWERNQTWLTFEVITAYNASSYESSTMNLESRLIEKY